MAIKSLEIYAGLSGELGSDLEFKSLGGMILIESEKHLAIMEEFVAQQRSSGLEVEIISQKELRRRQPYAREGFIASTYSAKDSQADPFRVMTAFGQRGRALGMELKRRTEVVDIAQTGSGLWRVTTADGTRYETEVVLNTAGAWAPLVGKMVDVDIPITPKRGQLIVTEQIPPIGETNVWSAEYIVTKLKPELAQKREAELDQIGLGFSFSRTADQNYLIGSTRELAGYDKSTTYTALKAIARQVADFFPVMKKVHIIRTIAGLRPSCADGKPVLGEHPGRPGFFTAAGHEGDGIALAPITGRIVSQLICGQKTELDVSELTPARFSGTRNMKEVPMS